VTGDEASVTENLVERVVLLVTAIPAASAVLTVTFPVTAMVAAPFAYQSSSSMLRLYAEPPASRCRRRCR
jgi:hypothetical protein